MTFRIGRTLPPAAAPIFFSDILAGIAGIATGEDGIKRFEKELREFFKVRHCFAVSSGKAALVLVLKALKKLQPDRDEVIIPAYTCYSVPSAISKSGLKIKLCDLAIGSLDFDYEQLEKLLENPRILCVVPTHLFGLPVDIERVKALAEKRGIFVVEDAAQAMGSEWNGKKSGTTGDVGLFSLGRGKAFSTVEGGIIITENAQIGEAIESQVIFLENPGLLDNIKIFIYALAVSFLINPWVFWLPRSLPFLKLGETIFDTSFPIRRLSAFQAGLARGWRNRLTNFRKTRLYNAIGFYRHGITYPGLTGTKIPDMIKFPVLIADLDKKKELLDKSEKSGLGISSGYPDIVSSIKELEYLSDQTSFPAAKAVARTLVALPVHPFLNESDLKKIIQTVKTAIQPSAIKITS